MIIQASTFFISTSATGNPGTPGTDWLTENLRMHNVHCDITASLQVIPREGKAGEIRGTFRPGLGVSGMDI